MPTSGVSTGLGHYWYRGPWQWVTDEEGSRWSPPAGCYCGLDLRALPQQAQRGGEPGLGVFVGIKPPSDIGSDYDLLGSGSFTDIKESAKLRDMLPTRRGYRPAGDNMKRMLFNLLTEGSDPQGLDFAKPLMPDSRGMLDLQIAGEQLRQVFRLGKHGHTNRVLSVIRDDMEQHIEDAQRGKLKDREHYRRVLDAHCVKYGTDDWGLFVKTNRRREIPGRLQHETTYTDGFLAADALAGWTAVDGTWNNSGDTIRCTGGGSSMPATIRYNSDLSSDDHYSQIDFLTSSDVFGFLCGAVRFSPSAETCYMGLIRSLSSVSAIVKIISGTFTILVDTGVGAGPPHTDKLSVSGSSLELFKDAVSVATVTDTSITGNLRCGLAAHYDGPTVTGDNWIAEDIVTAPATPTRRELQLETRLNTRLRTHL